MEITDKIIVSIRLAIKNSGGQKALSDKCKIPQGYLSRYINKKVKNISLENFLKLEPHLDVFSEERKAREIKWKEFLTERKKVFLLTRICTYVYDDNTGEKINNIYALLGKAIDGETPYIDFDEANIDLQKAIFRHPLLSAKKKEELIAELRKLEKDKIELLEMKLKISNQNKGVEK